MLWASLRDPEADNALFEALERTVRQTGRERIERIDANINDDAFVDAVVAAFSPSIPAARGGPDAPI